MGIEVKDLGFSYGTHRVLDGVSFQGGRGDLIAVLGANGAGKSTLFRCVCGLLTGYSGEILINGNDVRALKSRELARLCAYIPQSAAPAFDYTALETVLMGLTAQMPLLASPGRTHERAAMDALDSLGISALAQRGVGRISGGERQLVLIARALAQGAGLLVMDEPTANLDYGNQLLVMERVRVLTADGYTVVLSTHNPDHALRYADRVLLLHRGAVLAQGVPQEVMTGERLSQLYGVTVRISEIEGEPPVRVCIPEGSSHGKI